MAGILVTPSPRKPLINILRKRKDNEKRNHDDPASMRAISEIHSILKKNATSPQNRSSQNPSTIPKRTSNPIPKDKRFKTIQSTNDYFDSPNNYELLENDSFLADRKPLELPIYSLTHNKTSVHPFHP